MNPPNFGSPENLPCFFPVIPTAEEKFERTLRSITNSDLHFEAEVEVFGSEIETEGRRSRNFPDAGVSVAQTETKGA